jgi:hypothetical protein
MTPAAFDQARHTLIAYEPELTALTATTLGSI